VQVFSWKAAEEKTGQLGMWTGWRDAGFFGQRRDSLGDRLSRSFMHVRIHDRGALSWFQLGRALGLSGSGAAQAARIVNVGRCLAVVMHEVILRV